MTLEWKQNSRLNQVQTIQIGSHSGITVSCFPLISFASSADITKCNYCSFYYYYFYLNIFKKPNFWVGIIFVFMKHWNLWSWDLFSCRLLKNVEHGVETIVADAHIYHMRLQDLPWYTQGYNSLFDQNPSRRSSLPLRNRTYKHETM